MESFQTAPVIRFYGADADAPGDSPDSTLPVNANRSELRLVPPESASAPGRLVALAALAGVAALGLATWAFASAVRAVDHKPSATAPARVAPPARPNLAPALTLLASPATQRFRVAGSVGRITLAVVPGGRSYLVLNGLGRAPSGKVYRAWVIPPAARAIRAAATFRGSTGLVPLRVPVPEGGAVAITIERAGHASGPSRTPRLVAVRR